MEQLEEMNLKERKMVKKLFLTLTILFSLLSAKEDLSGNKIVPVTKENIKKFLSETSVWSPEKDKIDINKFYTILSKNCKYLVLKYVNPFSTKNIDPYEEKGLCYEIYPENIIQRISKKEILGYLGGGDIAYYTFPTVELLKKYQYPNLGDRFIAKTDGKVTYTTVMGEEKTVPKLKIFAKFYLKEIGETNDLLPIVKAYITDN